MDTHSVSGFPGPLLPEQVTPLAYGHVSGWKVHMTGGAAATWACFVLSGSCRGVLTAVVCGTDAQSGVSDAFSVATSDDGEFVVVVTPDRSGQGPRFPRM